MKNILLPYQREKKKQAPKIFCISYQRTGTTSLGHFFKDHGFKVQGYDPEQSPIWSYLYDIGNYEEIFSSKNFQNNQVFEDNPWWANDFYKFLFHHFPKSKFIVINRDSDKWFHSMCSHSHQKTLGNTFRHVKLYNREEELYNLYPEIDFNSKNIDNLLPLNNNYKEHYISIYNARNREIKQFFSHLDPTRLVTVDLEDPLKWKKLGDYFNFTVADGYNVHKNKSQK